MTTIQQASCAALMALTPLFASGTADAAARRINRPLLDAAALPACFTRDGERVKYFARKNLPDVAMAYRIKAGDRVAAAVFGRDRLPNMPGAYIAYNPRILSLMSLKSQAHVLAHECGHQRLGHTDNHKPTRSEVVRNENEADCEAVKIMRHEYGMSADHIKSGLTVFIAGPFARMPRAATRDHGTGHERFARGMRCIPD